MNLELKKNRDDLLFEKEYNLNTRLLEIDLLVIKKNADVKIDNEIGRIFRGHNILEFKYHYLTSWINGTCWSYWKK